MSVVVLPIGLGAGVLCSHPFRLWRIGVRPACFADALVVCDIVKRRRNEGDR